MKLPRSRLKQIIKEELEKAAIAEQRALSRDVRGLSLQNVPIASGAPSVHSRIAPMPNPEFKGRAKVKYDHRHINAAHHIYKALKGWGTDEEALQIVLGGAAGIQLLQVEAAFNDLPEVKEDWDDYGGLTQWLIDDGEEQYAQKINLAGQMEVEDQPPEYKKPAPQTWCAHIRHVDGTVSVHSFELPLPPTSMATPDQEEKWAFRTAQAEGRWRFSRLKPGPMDTGAKLLKVTKGKCARATVGSGTRVSRATQEPEPEVESLDEIKQLIKKELQNL